MKITLLKAFPAPYRQRMTAFAAGESLGGGPRDIAVTVASGDAAGAIRRCGRSRSSLSGEYPGMGYTHTANGRGNPEGCFRPGAIK